MKKENYNQSIQDMADQLVRYYRIPVGRNKEDVLNAIFNQIKVKENNKKRHSIKLTTVLFGKIAAALIVLILALHFFTATITYSGKNGETLAYRLPDHSRVVLQDNSNIQFKKYLGKRKIALAGTAYFEVEKGSKFQVKTKLGKVEVLGTRFLVSEQEDSLNVMCYSGRVKASTMYNSFILEPGTQFSGTQSSGKKEPVPTHREYPDFARFNKSFPNVALSKVMGEIEAFFDVKIDIQNGKARSFSGTIQTGKLESALEIVCQSMQLKYRYANKYRIEIFK
ncbi:MAG TPA: FecR family protein [Draconibacterium sp.]|nr:FecR family protein [Draconibacterium sp.]